MNKRFRFFLIASTIIIISLIACSFITVEDSREIKIAANLFDVLEELNNPQNWKNWQCHLKDDIQKKPQYFKAASDTLSNSFSIESLHHSFYVKKISPVSFNVKEKTGQETLLYNLTVLSTVLPDYTNVVTTTRLNLLTYLFLRDNKTRAFSTASDLKAFIENPSTYYGYSLTIEKTIDTIVVVKDIVTRVENWRPALSSIYAKLSSFIDSHKLKVVQPQIVSFKSLSKDSLEIRAGVPVNKVVADTGDIKCLRMPKGDMLVGEFKGPFNKRNSLSRAMEKYIQNHSLKEIAVPYEKYLNNQIPMTDTSEVNIKMYYPILN